MAFTKVVGAGIHTLSNITSHNVHSSGIITATRFDGPFTNLNITGVATFAGDVSIGGTLTYEDVTNIDSVGIITARNGIFLPDNKKVHLGNASGSGDLQIYHDSTTGSYLKESGPGAFRIQGDAGIWIQSASNNQDRIVTNHNGDVQLFYSGNKKLNTTNTGVEVTGILTASNGLDAIGIQSGGVDIATGVITKINFVGAGNTFKVDGTTVDVSISGNTGAGGTWSSYTAGIATTKSVGINTNNFDDPDVVGAGNSLQGLYISNGMIIHDNSLNGNHYIGTAMNGLMAGPVTINGVLTVEGNYVVV
jgi:hypothetical protein